MVTIYDIAKITGYSPATVSKALNGYSDIGDKTKNLILNTAKEMGYIANYSAKALITKKSWMIGVLYSEIQGMGLEHPLFGGILEGFRTRVEEEGYEMLFISRNLGGREMSYLEHCKHRGVDGVFISLVDQSDPDLAELIASGIPCVSTDFIYPDLPSVISNNEQGAFEGMQHLLKLGHKRIAHIAGPEGFNASEDRLKAYREILEANGIKFNKSMVAACNQFDYISGYKAMKELLSRDIEKPTAVFAACDTIAYGAIMAAREKGYRIPEDISFLGFDDIDSSAFSNPPLTTLRQDRKALGRTAAETLLTILRGEELSIKDIKVPVELKIRASCIKNDGKI